MEDSHGSHSLLAKALAWSVHVLTASGILVGLMAIIAIADHEWRDAMLWLFLGLLIDGIDGTFARLFRVKEVLPNMDGKAIDYVIDFANYALIPAYFCYESGLVPDQWRLLAAFLMLLVAAIYYGKSGMVSEDLYFVGFPVLWNLAVFYLFFVTEFGVWGNLGMIVFLSILHFVPIKFLYPSQTSAFRYLNVAVTVIFFGVNTALLWLYPESPAFLQWISLAVVVYFGGMAVYETWIR